MAQKILVEIITPEQIKFSRMADLVVVPAVEGSLGVMAGHIPLVTRLEVGEARIHDGNELLRFAISGGYLEVTPEKAVVLADSAETPEEIDLKRAEESKERAAERLKGLHRDQVDHLRAQASLHRALNRIRLVQEYYGDRGHADS